MNTANAPKSTPYIVNAASDPFAITGSPLPTSIYPFDLRSLSHINPTILIKKVRKQPKAIVFFAPLFDPKGFLRSNFDNQFKILNHVFTTGGTIAS